MCICFFHSYYNYNYIPNQIKYLCIGEYLCLLRIKTSKKKLFWQFKLLLVNVCASGVVKVALGKMRCEDMKLQGIIM
jgi:hypothetical protein